MYDILIDQSLFCLSKSVQQLVLQIEIEDNLGAKQGHSSIFEVRICGL